MKPFQRASLRKLLCLVLLGSLQVAIPVAAQSERPLLIGVSAEFGMQGSHAAQSIEKGILLAIDEVNQAGGVLGRKLALEKRDDRGVPARALDNLADLAALPDLVAVFCGRFSPVAMEVAPVANRLRVPYLDPWAAADGITQQAPPNFVFRLSLTDSWAMESLLAHALGRGIKNVSLLLPNTAWGRSSEAAAVAYTKRHPTLHATAHWYNWGDTDFSGFLSQARAEGARAIVMVANEAEGAFVVKQMAALPVDQRLPLIAHWGVAGGDFAAQTGPALKAVDLVVVQTFTFNGARGAKAAAVAAGVKRLFGHEVSAMRGQVGFAHAYDLTHLLAQAIKKAGRADRDAIRVALEKLNPHEGLVRAYRRPFSPANHEALDSKQPFLTRFDSDGNLKALGKD